MPAVSKAQRRLMGAAEHGAQFPMARKLRASMTHQQLHDFAATKEKKLPGHVGHKSQTRHHSGQFRGHARSRTHGNHDWSFK